MTGNASVISQKPVPFSGYLTNAKNPERNAPGFCVLWTKEDQ